MISAVSINASARLAVTSQPHIVHWNGTAASENTAITKSQMNRTADSGVLSKIRRLSLRILVVDDEDEFRASVVVRLRSVYCAYVEEAEAASIALEKAGKGAFNLILMDVAMPQVDGFQARKEMINRGIRVPVVLMSAHPENHDEARSQGIRFLDKPLDTRSLEEVLMSSGEQVP